MGSATQYISKQCIRINGHACPGPTHLALTINPSTTWPSEECSDGQSSREDCDDNQQQECSDDQHQDFREQPTSSELPTKISIIILTSCTHYSPNSYRNTDAPSRSQQKE